MNDLFRQREGNIVAALTHQLTVLMNERTCEEELSAKDPYLNEFGVVVDKPECIRVFAVPLPEAIWQHGGLAALHTEDAYKQHVPSLLTTTLPAGERIIGVVHRSLSPVPRVLLGNEDLDRDEKRRLAGVVTPTTLGVFETRLYLAWADPSDYDRVHVRTNEDSDLEGRELNELIKVWMHLREAIGG